MTRSQHRRSIQKGESGYVLLTLLLIVALLIVAAAAAFPYIAFEIRRDREEELIHRGVQYSRAIRGYYKKFGRYPTRLEELESTNNLRFLRKRYKDPITGQDFKLLHFGEVKLTFSAPGAGISNINGASSLNSPGGLGVQPTNGPAGGSFSGPTGFGAAARSASPDSSNSTPDPNQTPSSNSASPSAGQQQGQSASSSGDQLSGQTFGGGPVVGVVSASKKDSVREFNHKKKYNEWQFIYDPATDRGGLLSTPNQPPLQGLGNQQGQATQQGTTGITTVGPIPGMQNNPGYPSAPDGPGTPPLPPDQQQK